MHIYLLGILFRLGESTWKVIRTPLNAIHKSPMKSALVKCLSWASRAHHPQPSKIGFRYKVYAWNQLTENSTSNAVKERHLKPVHRKLYHPVSLHATDRTSLGYRGYHPHRHHYHHFLRSITCTSSFSASSPSCTKTDHIYIRKVDDDNGNNKRTVDVD